MERNSTSASNLIPLQTLPMDSSSSRWRVESDWYSPTRLRDSPIHYDFPGDRFIPNRSLMDLDQAQSLLTNRIKEPRKPKFSEGYRRKMEEHLSLDREGRPFKMLVFRGSPKSSRTSVRLIDEMRRSDEEMFVRTNKHSRKLPMKERRVLDLPLIQNDYYTNVMDWGKTNILAIALGPVLYFWNAETECPQMVFQVKQENDYPTSVIWSDDGKTVAIGHECSALQLWDAESCKLVRNLEGHERRVAAVSWNGHMLTSGGADRAIINHDVRARNSVVSCIEAHIGVVCGLKWSSRGNILASGGNDNHIYLWEASMMSSPSHFLHRFNSHVSAIKALAWCPHDDNVLASGGGTKDGCIKLWNIQKGTCINSIDTNAQVCGLEWSRHQKEILSGHGYSRSVEYNNQLCLWRYPSLSKLGEVARHSSRVLHLSQSPNGLTVASAGADERLRFWDLFGPPKADHLSDLDSLLALKSSPLR